MTEHEDIELGRCVLHHTGVGCTKSYEMGTLFKNNYNVEETDSEGLKPVFEEVAGHSGMVFTSFIELVKITENDRIYEIERSLTTICELTVLKTVCFGRSPPSRLSVGSNKDFCLKLVKNFESNISCK